MSDTLERLRKVTPLLTHKEFTSVRIDLLQAAASELATSIGVVKAQDERIAALEKERDTALLKLHQRSEQCAAAERDFDERVDAARAERDALALRLDSCEAVIKRLLDWPSTPVDFSASYVMSGRSEMSAALKELNELKQAARATVVERQEIKDAG